MLMHENDDAIQKWYIKGKNEIKLNYSGDCGAQWRKWVLFECVNMYILCTIQTVPCAVYNTQWI